VLNLSLVACSDTDVCDSIIEVEPLLILVEECINADVSVVT
jgi:hypothetical protein